MTIPSLSELISSIKSDLRNRLQLATLFGKAALNAISNTQGAKLKLFYLQSAFIYKNIFPDTADPDELDGTLSRFGLMKLGRLQNPATAGEYIVNVSGTIGATIAPGTTFKSLDASTSPNKIFQLDTLFTFTSSSGTILLRSLELGPDAQLNIGDELQLTQPISNVDSFADVSVINIVPLEAESVEDYRQAVIQAYQLESQGGAKTDYRLWSEDAQGVRLVYPYTSSPSIIDLYIEATVSDSSDGKGTPTQAIIDEVKSVIEFDPDTTKPLNERGRRPMGAFQINFLTITPLNVDIEIQGLSDTSYLNPITSAIESHLFNIRPYIDGADNPNQSQKGYVYEADIFAIVRNVIGNSASFTTLQMNINGIHRTVYEFTGGNIPYLNSVTNV